MNSTQELTPNQLTHNQLCILNNLDKTLPPLYARKLQQIKRVNDNCTNEEAIALLIDLYYLDSYKDLKTFYKSLSARIDQPLDKPFLYKLKLIYTYLGHFLRKINYVI